MSPTAPASTPIGEPLPLEIFPPASPPDCRYVPADTGPPYVQTPSWKMPHTFDDTGPPNEPAPATSSEPRWEEVLHEPHSHGTPSARHMLQITFAENTRAFRGRKPSRSSSSPMAR